MYEILIKFHLAGLLQSLKSSVASGDMDAYKMEFPAVSILGDILSAVEEAKKNGRPQLPLEPVDDLSIVDPPSAERRFVKARRTAK